MNSLSDFYTSILNYKLKKKYLIIILSSLFCGLISQGMAIFNKISFHDDFITFSSAGYTSGRWAGTIIDYILKKLWGESFSTPIFYGIIAIVLVGIATCIMCEIFDINQPVFLILIAGLMVVFPSVTTIYGFMFMIHTYALAICLTSVAALMVIKTRNWICFVGASIIAGFAFGIYQAFIPLYISVFVLHIFVNCMYFDGEYKTTWKEFILNGLYYVGAICTSMICYFIPLKIILAIKGAELNDYNGISTMGQDSILTYFGRIKVAYSTFFVPQRGMADVFPKVTYYIRETILLFVLAMIVFGLVSVWKQSKVQFSQVLLMVLVIPIAINFIYVMCGAEHTSVYSPMLYSFVLLFVLFFVILEKNLANEETVYSIVGIIGLLLISFALITYCKFDNAYHVKGLFLQEHARTYYDGLYTRIISTDGYDKDMPIAFINGDNKVELNDYVIDDQMPITLPPYHDVSVINSYTWKPFFEIWCGFDFDEVENTNTYEKLEAVQEMPSYPTEGSIKVIDGVLVVKF